MVSVQKVAGAVLLGVFVLTIALRPLTNPAVTGALRDGATQWQTLLVAPLVLVGVGIVALRLHSLFRDEESDDYAATAVDRDAWSQVDDRESALDTGPEDEADSETSPAGAAHDSDGAETDDQQRQGEFNFLAGQGGAREKDFEIEEEPPDATLSEHLEHLRAELDDPESAAELDTLADVATEEAGENRIPGRCPQDHCEARWSERGILGLGTGKYELLDDGETVVCLECEQSVRLEPGE